MGALATVQRNPNGALAAARARPATRNHLVVRKGGRW